ncbi:MAG: Xaa-Pro peptidase family protein [Bryobacteraceae bacterium]|nr:Xaa-Pro peptidase family protein [Bryobacteraceae bacterium]
MHLRSGGPRFAAESVPWQTDFPATEFRQRHERIFDHIGNRAVALVAGAAAADGFQIFRPSNEFYYLCGIETPQSYLLLDGRTRTVSLYLPHRDTDREKNAGKLLSAEDPDLVRTLTGVDAVYGVEVLSRHLAGLGLRPPAPAVFVPHSPAEGVASSRDELLYQRALIAADPWDGQSPREAWFLDLLRRRLPALEIRNLTPVMDELRAIKSEREISLIRRASQIAARGILEAMRSTRFGLAEYQLDATARYIFLLNGARYEGYPSITAGGTNAFFGHYFRKDSILADGDLVLMDFAPDYRYYTSDVTRIWPVNGKFSDDQRKLWEFIGAHREALIRRIRPGATADGILDGARDEMKKFVSKLVFTVFNQSNIPDQAWTQHRFTFVAAEANSDIRFGFQNPIDDNGRPRQMGHPDTGRTPSMEMRLLRFLLFRATR